MAMTDATRHGNALPSLSYIDLDKIKKENSFYNARIPSSTAANVPAPALVSPSSMCSGPPPPYSYPSSTASSVVNGYTNGYTNGYISPPSEPRKPLDIEKDQQHPPSPSNSVNWRHNDRDRPDDDYGRNGGLKEHVMKPTYGEAVKRHLDNFDLETSLNEIAEGGGRAIEFSSRYGNRAFLTQRSGPIPGSIPTLAECDEMMNHQKRVLDSMQSIKEIIIAQQHALAEQRNYEINHKPSSDADEDGASFSDKLEGSGGFAGADTKKRRGRAAPPGRCHSCNRAETPEWRRGPDGARTLCNACGLRE
ncbi:MAG: hypothetical protein L6R37_003070 [Teloschistes peruensis]|nr:MAG: hypothetical protein L6R37_003070 [Teloschistes peruensis]